MTTHPSAPREAVAVVTTGQHTVAQAGQWSNREAQIIANVLGRDLTSDDLRAYAAICRHTGLDPFRRQIYAWKDKGRLTIHIAIGGWRGMAARSGAYAGQTPPQWCGPDGAWRDVWLEEGPPAAARVGVYRTGAAEPCWGIVTYREFQRTQSRSGAKGPTLWDEKPAHMLATRAEYQALQKACPEAFETSTEAIQQFNVAVEAVADEEIPPTPVPDLVGSAEPRMIDPATGEVTESEPDQDRRAYPWEAELRHEMEAAGLPLAALERVVGTPLTFALIEEWMAAGEGRTPHTLVRAAADAMAASTEGKRR